MERFGKNIEFPIRVAAVDIGSNSVRATVVEISSSGQQRVLDDERAYTRLGAGLGKGRMLSDESMDATIEALGRSLDIIRGYDVAMVKAIATAAVRDAENGGAFLERIGQELDLDVEMISGEEEARLAFVSACEHIPAKGEWVVLDLGGGSLEIAWAQDQRIAHAVSLPLGALTTTSRFISRDPASDKEFSRLQGFIDGALASISAPVGFKPKTLVASGGMARMLGAIVAARNDIHARDVRLFEFSTADLEDLVETLRHSTREERMAMKGMAEARVDTVLAGTYTILTVMRLAGVGRATVNPGGLREGMVADIARALTQSVADPTHRRELIELGRRYGFNETHAEHVRDLSLSLFSQLEKALVLTSDDRDLLEAAALLHDVGRVISYDQHNKHSYRVIRHSEISRFSGKEVLMIAAIARYHTGRPPRRAHEALEGLAPDEIARVENLAAILRVADGLDRTRTSRVVKARLKQAGDGSILVEIVGKDPLDAEVHAASMKVDMLEAALGRPVKVTIKGSPTQ